LWLQVTTPISPGSSGGPILDERGEVVGIATAIALGGQNLNFAVSSRHLWDLLEPHLSGTGARARRNEHHHKKN
jgi:S1-C subfamily serine protease